MKPDGSGTPIPRCKACGMGAGERCEDHDVEAPCGAHGIVSASDVSGVPIVGDLRLLREVATDHYNGGEGERIEQIEDAIDDLIRKYSEASS